ncbi:MAG: DUF3047 domain-containing protein [Alkalispirochaetaceae bacterium]
MIRLRTPFTLILLCLLHLSVHATEGFRSEFDSLDGWRLVNIDEDLDPGIFEIIEREGESLLRVVSDNTVSMIVREEPIDVYQTPVLTWSWNLLEPVEDADLRNLFSEDTAIRIVVAFRDELDNLPWWLRIWASRQAEAHGELPPTSALNYIWAAREYEEEPVKSLYSRRIQFYIADAGDEGVGTWQSHSVNIVEDYRRAMGEDPPAEAFIAVLSDTDNTKGYAEALIDSLSVVPEGASPGPPAP